MTEAQRRRVLLVLAGAADAPAESTPLTEAETPGLDSMARRGRAGTADLGATTPWNGFVALLGLAEGAAALGPCEALGAGIALEAGSAAWRADFVTVADRGLRDPHGGRVKEPEAGLLLDAARAAIPGVALHRLEGHRNLAVAAGPAEFAPSPWEMVGRRPLSGLPEEGRLRGWFEAASAALAGHDVNAVRLDLLENPANALWFHGGGAPVETPLRAPIAASHPVLVGRGRVTSGLAKALGWDAAVVDGDDETLAGEALARIAASDLVVVRTESVLWATAHGAAAKRDALSAADARLVRPLLSALEETDLYTFVVAADSVLDTASAALVRRPVPLAVMTSGDGNDGARFTELACERSGFRCGSGREVAALLAP
jgi:2,3-bisphosphoglycerate-independent phosphoglycerate mutase